MKSRFTVEEKRSWKLKKHLKDHLFEYVLELVLHAVFVYLLLKLCRAENVAFGVLLSVFYSLGKMIYQIVLYKKEYVDVNIE